MNQKRAPKKYAFLVVLLWVIIILAFCSNKKSDDNAPTEKSIEDTSKVEEFEDMADTVPDETQEEDTLKLKHGELISAFEDAEKGTIIIKAKIKGIGSNKLTIKQNYLNMEDFIKNKDGNTYNEIQYWAVSDMSSGEESKVISFTMDKDLIDSVYNEKVFASDMENYVSDLYIHESLLSN